MSVDVDKSITSIIKSRKLILKLLQIHVGECGVNTSVFDLRCSLGVGFTSFLDATLTMEVFSASKRRHRQAPISVSMWVSSTLLFSPSFNLMCSSHVGSGFYTHPSSILSSRTRITGFSMVVSQGIPCLTVNNPHLNLHIIQCSPVFHIYYHTFWSFHSLL